MTAVRSGPLSLPRNTPVWLPLLAEILVREEPDVLLHLSPIESRDTLALYEAWQNRSPKPCRIVGLSVHPHVPVAERRRRLAAALAAVRPESPLPDPARFTEQVRGWRRWERSLPDLPRGTAWEWYRALRPAVDVWASLPAPFAPPADEPLAEKAFPRLALFGDWLLGPDLMTFIATAGWRLVLVQFLHDLVDWPDGLDPDDAWLRHPFFQALPEKLPRYHSLLREREVRAVVVVTASFSPPVTMLRKFARALPCPTLLLESEIPGFLTVQDRIRLENFLRQAGLP
ncbi:MAG: hypothetical protein JXQ27_17980 [Acidobacteria bacterium]|nr:hypothetical protein [Acidobacteriota bacterium]